MTTQKELDKEIVETLQQMVREKKPINEIAEYLEATIDLSVSTIAVKKELDIVEVIQSLEQIFPKPQ